MLLNPLVLTNLLLDTIFVLLGFIAFFVSLEILLKYKPQSYTQEEFLLQKKAYLSSTIISYILTLKIPLFLFFIYTLNALAPLLKGAMCSVGVLEGSVYGIYLMIIKVIALYLFGFWIVLHKKDIASPYQAYLRLKSWYFLVIYIVLVVEYILEINYFLDLQPDALVDCCGVVFSPNKTTLIATLLSVPNYLQYGFFYFLYGVIVLGFFTQKKLLYSFATIVFIPTALISLIAYFGTYIYELPTHHCPFCLLQADYYYIGYFLYSFLFLGTFLGIALTLYNLGRKIFQLSFIFITLYVIVVSCYPLFYFIKNGVWLY
ncbi:MAG: hypothetical protein GXO11_07040 [Epsilonproteobacteria bacterium]|nr:hypothetical protein [Campylobacterota bacterium]